MFIKKDPSDRMSQADALANGLHRYLSEIPCSEGHAGMHYTKTGVCCACHVIRMREYQRRRNHPLLELIKLWVPRGSAGTVREHVARLAAANNIPDIAAELKSYNEAADERMDRARRMKLFKEALS